MYFVLLAENILRTLTKHRQLHAVVISCHPIFVTIKVILINTSTQKCRPGWQMLGYRGNSGARKVRVFYERKDPQHTPFCRKTIQLSMKVILLWECFQRKSACFWRAFNKSQPAFGELLGSPLSESFRIAFRKLSERFRSAFGELSESFQRAFVEAAFGELLESPLLESFRTTSTKVHI